MATITAGDQRVPYAAGARGRALSLSLGVARRWARRYERRWRPPGLAPGQRMEDPERRGMLLFWLDGLLANISESFVAPYLSLYLLALGASGGQVGIFTAVTGLVGALMFLPGARLAERSPHYRGVVVATSLVARAMLPLLLLVPWTVSGQPAIAAVIVLAALRTASTQLGVPAWTAFAATIVPPSMRGRYFASRTFAMSLAALIVVPAAGRLISALGVPQGYQVSFGLAFAAGLLSSYAYSRIPLPAGGAPTHAPGLSFRQVLGALRASPAFLRLCLTSMLLNLGVQLVAPFFNVYMVRDMGLSAGFVGLTATASTAFDLVGQRFFGPFVDRRGLRRTMALTSPFIALLPFAWLFVSEPWHIFPIQIVGGFAWAGYNLAVFNYLLASTPDGKHPLYSAIYNTANGAATVLGPLAGGLIFDVWGFHPCLIASFAGRVVAAALIILLLREAGQRVVGPAVRVRRT